MTSGSGSGSGRGSRARWKQTCGSIVGRLVPLFFAGAALATTQQLVMREIASGGTLLILEAARKPDNKAVR